jgi:hypothetical protein
MRHGRVLLWAAFALLAPSLLALTGTACDNNVIVPDGDGGGNTGGEGVGLFLPATSNTGGADAGQDALSEFIDPGCKDKPPPLQQFVCDPQNQFNGDCAEGEGCYIFVDYPSDPCGQEIYGSICFPAGFGQQGDPCSGAQDCGAGLSCVVTGSGTQCVQLCELDDGDACTGGTVCEPIDVEGFGGCL